jgi:hypothetical protein
MPYLKFLKDWEKVQSSRISVPTISAVPTSAVSLMLADLPAVQRLVDHVSVNTTARYDCRGEAAAKKAAEMIEL